MSDDATKYRVRMFCQLNFYRGTLTPAHQGYGIELVSREFDTQAEAAVERFLVEGVTQDPAWTFTVEEVEPQ